MNVDLYETLPTSSVGVHMTAGAIAGITEHCFMYPLDTVKTRMQTIGPEGGGRLSQVFMKMVRQEGVLRSFRGIGMMAAGAGPAHALYFSCYEFLKSEMLTFKILPQFKWLVYGTAGGIATLLHDGLMNPAEVVKQRLQMYNSPYRSIFNCIKQVYKTEGVVAFYRSYTTQLMMNVPFQSIHFITYELSQSFTNPDRKYNPLAHITSGATAGAVAAAATTPLDVCKTLLNTQQGEVRPQGMIDAMRTVHKLRGIPGFFRGWEARIISIMPGTAVCWTMYESFKYLLQSSHISTHIPPEFPKEEDGSNISGSFQSPLTRSPFQGPGIELELNYLKT